MDNNVPIVRTVVDKATFNKVVDNSFKVFTQPVEESDTDTIEELFRLYDKLYYTIDVYGEANSHEYLVNKSSELADFTKDTESIQPLLDEIAQLREQLLLANQEILTLQTTTT